MSAIPSLRIAIRLAERLGLEVRQRRRTGELIVRDPGGAFLSINARRADAPRVLVTLLRRVKAEGGRS